MGNNSKWSQYNSKIDELISKGRTDWTRMSFDVLGKQDTTDSLRTYIKRRANQE